MGVKDAIRLRKLRADPCYFARELLGVELHPYQQAALRCESPTTVLCWGRGAGKTMIAVIYALWKCYTQKNYTCIFIAARFQQAKYAGDVLLGLIAGTPLMDFIVERSSEHLKWFNGSELHIIPGQNPTAARGWHNRYSREGAPHGVLVVADEAATIPRTTYTAMLSIVNTTPNGKILIVGSPLGVNHWFYSEYCAGLDKAELFTKSFHTPSTACPHISESRIAEYKEKMLPVEFGAEILAEFQSALDSYLAGIVSPAIKPYAIPAPRHPRCQYYIGVDLSSSIHGKSWTAITVIEKYGGGVRAKAVEGGGVDSKFIASGENETLPAYTRVVDIRRARYYSVEDLRLILRELKDRYMVSDVYAESYESMMLEQVVDSVGMCLTRIVPSNPAQREAFAFLHEQLRNGLLWLPQDGPGASQLLKECRGLTYELTDAGNVTFGGGDSSTDDIVYSLLWVLFGSRNEFGRPMEIY